jgi:hypothetical protein
MLPKILAIVGLLILAWLPVSLGIQALHRTQAKQPWTALALLVCATLTNAVSIVMVGPRVAFIISNLG